MWRNNYLFLCRKYKEPLNRNGRCHYQNRILEVASFSEASLPTASLLSSSRVKDISTLILIKSSRSTADFLIVISERISRASNRPAATQAVAIDIPRLSAGFGMLVFFKRYTQDFRQGLACSSSKS